MMVGDDLVTHLDDNKINKLFSADKTGDQS
jgi:hypothetical protein